MSNYWMKSGIKDGPEDIFENGILKFTFFYVDGKKHGQSFVYVNGQKLQKCSFKQGVPDGQSHKYHNNGRI